MNEKSMNGEQRQVLEMLANGKVSVEEAQELLSALAGSAAVPAESATNDTSAAPRKNARWLRMTVHKVRDGAPSKEVNLRIPVALVRAGMKLSSFIPGTSPAFIVGGKAEKSCEGVRLDMKTIDIKQVESIVNEMGDMTIDLDDGKSKVRIWAE